MEIQSNVILFSMLVGIIGTGLGGVIAVALGNVPKRVLGFMLEFAAGLMIAVVCFDLIPHALAVSDLLTVCIGIVSGTALVIVLDDFIKKMKFSKNVQNQNVGLKTGILIAIGIALHNFPEGLAVGSGFEASLKLGLSIALVIAVHDIPEGIAVALPLRLSGISRMKTILYTTLTGVPTAFGALLGIIFGAISIKLIAMCLGIAAGAMIYIVCSELMPEAKKVHRGRISSIGNMLGLICGILISCI